jgi:hypothetical protein
MTNEFGGLMYNTYGPSSDRKNQHQHQHRLPTSESVESNNSGQFNYPIVGMNLNPQFNSNESTPMQYYISEE